MVNHDVMRQRPACCFDIRGRQLADESGTPVKLQLCFGVDFVVIQSSSVTETSTGMVKLRIKLKR